MPVLRQRERMRDDVSFSPVRARVSGLGETGFSRVVDQSVSMLAKQAGDFARGMALTAEDEARRLAKAAVFSADASGMPQLPPNPTARMGRIAQRTYDAGIEDRFISQMTNAARAQIAEAENANLYDLDGFTADAEARMAAMGQDVPEGFEGLFQQILGGLIVDGGAGVGYRQGQLAINEATASVPGMLLDSTASIEEAILAGDPSVDELINMTVENIEAQPAYILDRAAKDRAIDEVYYKAGLRRLMVDFDLDEASANDLQAIQAALINPTEENKEILDYFIRPGMDAPDMEMAQQAAGHIGQLIGAANDRDRSRSDRATKGARMDSILRGEASDSSENAELLDEHLTANAGLRDARGMVRAVQPDDWLYVEGHKRADMVQAVKGSGIVPASMQQLFRRLERGNYESDNPAELKQAFLLWRDLQEQPTQGGVTVDMSGVAGERLTAIFGLVSDLHGSGDITDEDVWTAVTMVGNLEEQEWDDTRLASALSKSNWFTNEDRKEARRVMGEKVQSEVFDKLDVEPLEKERAEAEKVFETYLRTGYDPDTALDMVKQQFSTRYQPSKAMGGARSAYAPEKWYPAKPAATFGAAVNDLRRAAAQAIFGSSKTGRAIFQAMSGNVASDYGMATPFEVIANAHIESMIKRNGIEFFQAGVSLDNKGKRFLRAGIDYEVTKGAIGRNGMPIYKVTLIQPSGTRIPLSGMLDITQDYETYRKIEVDAVAIERAMRSREAEITLQDLLAGNPNAGEWWKIIEETP